MLQVINDPYGGGGVTSDSKRDENILIICEQALIYGRGDSYVPDSLKYINKMSLVAKATDSDLHRLNMKSQIVCDVKPCRLVNSYIQTERAAAIFWV